MIIPNSYQKPNWLTDQMMWLLSGDEWKVLDYALRRTFGFNRERDRISVSQFVDGNGKLDAEGRPLEYGTGLSKGAVLDALNALMRFGVLVEVAPNNAAKQGRLWELQLDSAKVRLDLLLERREAKQARGRVKTAAARQAAQAARGAVPEAASPPQKPATDSLPLPTISAADDIGLSHRPVEAADGSVCPTDRYRSVPQTSIGLSHRPVSVCPTDPQKHSGKPEETQGETHSGGAVAVPANGVVAVPANGVVAAWRELAALCDGDEAKATQIWRLQERFAAVTKLKRPDPETEAGRAKLRRDWWPNLILILADADGDLEAAEAAMQEAFGTMVNRAEPLNVVSPRSLVNVTSGVLARRRRGDQPPALVQRPKGMAGIDAYAKRRGIPNGN